jgi:thiamine-phosphate pyrophosphorylase
VKHYLITDPTFYGSTPEMIESALDVIYSHRLPDFTLFRDKQTDHCRDLAQIFVTVSRSYKIPRVLLHGDYALARELGADGVHLTSTQFEDIVEAKKVGLYVIISTHTHEEALKAQTLGADAITYSPIFPSPNKGEPKGLEDLKEIVDKIEIPIFALGGITTEEQVNTVLATGAYGFASIRYFIS